MDKLVKEIKELMPIAYSKAIPTVSAYADNGVTIGEVEDTLRSKFKELAGDYYSYKENKYKVFALITEEIAETLPRDVKDAIEIFADVKNYKQSDKGEFTLKLGKKNVKRFVTAIGLGGIYERVRLDKTRFTVPTKGFGGAVYIEFEQYLDGAFDFYELTQILVISIQGTIFDEIKKAFDKAVVGLPVSQKETGAGWVEPSIVKLRTKAKQYGDKVALVCTETFASTIPALTDGDKEDIRGGGMIKKALGMDIIVLPNGVNDEGELVFDDKRAYIFPTGGNADEKIVKVAIEGDTIIKEVENSDSSMEFQAYQKLGVAVLSTEALFVYENTSL